MQRWADTKTPLAIVLYILLVALVVIPIAILVFGALSVGGTGPSTSLLGRGLTLSNFSTLVGTETFRNALWNTEVAAGAGTMISVVIGTWLAFLVVRTDVPAKGMLALSAVIPFFVSAFVGAFAWTTLAHPTVGILNLAAKLIGWEVGLNINSVGGVAFALGLYHVPFIYLTVAAALYQMDPVLEEAARMSGSGVWATLITVSLPLVTPAILSGAILVFGLSAGNFAIPALLGTPGNVQFITPYIYRLLQFSPPRIELASAAGVILMIITLLLFSAQRRYVAGRTYLTVTGKGFRPRPIALGRWRWVCFASGLIYIVVAVVLPYLALIARSLRPFFFVHKLSDLWNLNLMSLSNFQFLIEYSQVRVSIVNTVFLAAVSGIVGTCLYFLFAYGSERLGKGGLSTIRYLAWVPSAVPGMVMGLSYFWAALYLPLPLYGTIWILLLAYLARFTPQGTSALSATIRHIHPELEESARMSGATALHALKDITFPLARPGIVSTFILVFVLAVTELHTSIMLYSAQSVVMSVVMYDFWQLGQWEQAAALSLVQTLLVVIILVLAQVIFRVGVHSVTPGQAGGRNHK